MAGHANLTLRKTLAGSLTADELTAVRAGLTFTVTRSDGTAVAVISGADMTVGTDPAQCAIPYRICLWRRRAARPTPTP